MSYPLRLAVVRDYQAEGWPSMDLCADQLLAHLPAEVEAIDIAPPFRRLFGRLPIPHRFGFNADRLVNRHLLLPSAVRRTACHTDFVHVVDHSYAHVVNSLPAGSAGVYCHDLDTFRCLLEPQREPRPWWFRRLARRILAGLRRAAVVFHNSRRTADELSAADIVPPERLVHAPLGVAAEFTPQTERPVVLPISTDFPFLLHVGSNIPRKRLDVLLEVFAAVRQRFPALRLIQVGGPWPATLAEQIARLGIAPLVIQLRGLSREQLAELYRRAAAVLVPSEAEGFGLPVIEALACGAIVVASDIPALREAGGLAAIYCPVANVTAWTETVCRVLTEPSGLPSRASRLSQAQQFSWSVHARIIADTYRRLLLLRKGCGEPCVESAA